MSDRIQFRRDTSANWASNNPTLASGELGLVTDTGAYKVGNGTDDWNTLVYNTMDNTVGTLTMADASDPSTPSAGTMAFYSRNVSGRSLPKFAGPSGLNSPLQPAIFQNSLWLVQPNTSTTVSSVGGAVTTVGTISTITPAANTYGLASNFVSTNTTNATAGTGQAVAPLNTSTTAVANGGFFFVCRLFFPDSNYGTGATGSRFFVGVTSNTMAVAVGADDPAGSRMGFAMSTNLSDTDWQFSTKDGATQDKNNTGMTFAVNTLYDFYIFMTPDGTTCYWRIDDLTNSTTNEGSTTTRLPASSTYMRGGFQIATLTTTARNVRMKKLYIETDN